MDTRLYDVYLTGKLADGLDRADAADRLAQIFKSAQATMLGLLTGKPQLLKRGVDKNTALKYREALQRAGVEVAFKPQAATPLVTGSQPIVPKTDNPAPVAANAAANFMQNAETGASAAPATVVSATPESTGQFSLAPAGADMLNDNERRQSVEAHIELGHLSLAAAGTQLEELPRNFTIPELPDLAHLSLQEAGGDLLSAEERTSLPASIPDTDNLSLAPVGAAIDTLHEERPPVEVDISQLSLAPAGTELLTPEQRRKHEGTAPSTAHLQLVQ